MGGLDKILAYFHELINDKVRAYEAQEAMTYYKIEYPTVKDLIKTLDLDIADSGWFGIPGMCGGFAYKLLYNNDKYILKTSNWSRVNAGSEQDHDITSEGIVQISGYGMGIKK